MIAISNINFVKIALSLLICTMLVEQLTAQEPTRPNPDAAVHSELAPLLEQYCYQCHGEGESSGDVALDSLATSGPELSGESWSAVLDVINSGDMPPEDEDQPTDEDRRKMVAGLTALLVKASQTKQVDQPVLRRLTRAQYTNSLQTLLGLNVDFGDVLPEDGKSEMGFSNNAEVLQTTSLHFEYYEKVARSAINKAVAFGPKPEPIRFRVTFGKGIETDVQKKTGREIRGFQSIPIKSTDFVVEMLDDDGNVRQPSDKTQIAKLKKMIDAIGVGMRGSANDRFEVVDDGVILFSALPHREEAPKSWQGPSPNLKVLFRHDFPREGDFRMKVNAARAPIGRGRKTAEGLISLRNTKPAKVTDETLTLKAEDCPSPGDMKLKGSSLVPTDVAGETFAKFRFELPENGIYQIDFVHPFVAADLMPSVEVEIDKSLKLEERLKIEGDAKKTGEVTTALTLANLNKGKHRLKIGGKFFTGFSEVRISRLDENDPETVNLRAETDVNASKFSTKIPGIAAFAGARTDDGMDYRNFGTAQDVGGEFNAKKSFEFVGRLENMPLPVYEVETRDSLSNISIFGIYNNHLVKKRGDSGPPLLVKSIELELPFAPVWPPASHTGIFSGEVPTGKDRRLKYTRNLLQQFMTRAFRHPVADNELDRYVEFWKATEADFDTYEEGIKEVLVAVLCSPNFLYVIEPSASDALTNDKPKEQPEPATDQFLLASRLSYFLWNSPPDETLLKLASEGSLVKELNAQTDRMIADPKVLRMIRPFAWEWLRVDRLESINIDTSMYSDFSRFVKSDMSEETTQFLHHVLVNDLPISNLIDSDFAVINQNLAEFYGIEGVEGNEFRAVKLPAGVQRGGLLSQGAFLTGHSDGQQAHPIKRAVWLKEKILGDPPPPPPPNVPDLDPETPGFEKLTLKQQLELHRDKPSCISCHKKIDPYGIVFENYDAVGRLITKKRKQAPVDASSVLPDGTEVTGVDGIKKYILENKREEFSRSLVEHLMTYALGRDIAYSDKQEVDGIVERVNQSDPSGGSFRTVFREIVLSPSFLK